MSCAQCGLDSPLTELFVRRRKSFSGTAVLLCPQCDRRRKDASAILAMWLVAIALVLLLITWATDDRSVLRSWALAENWALFVLLQILCLVPHEMAHAAAGWLMGFRVGRITFGRGRCLVSRRIGGVIVEVRRLLVVGAVYGTTDNMRAWRWRKIVFVGAGPLANLLLLLVAIVAAGPWPAILQADVTREVTPWLDLAAANLALLLSAMIGRAIATAYGTGTSDGRKLFQLFFKPLPTVEKRRSEHFQTLAHWNIQHTPSRQDIELIRQAAIDFPNDEPLLAMAATVQLTARDYAGGRQGLLALLRDHPKNDAFRAMTANNLAWADLMLDDPQLLDEADAASTEAYTLTPWVAAIQSTRGLLLVERGRLDEATLLLRKSLRGADNKGSRASIHCSLALAHLRRGDLRLAEASLSRARQLDRDCEVLPKLERRMRTRATVTAAVHAEAVGQSGRRWGAGSEG
ncbi:MAG TPA: site-2 protease family protein [Tepidisphaeraceae bacterium]|jgi:hypothetical protein|nr:site-2 protease family protein [Tepidisphaeraceae bacterium]